MDSRQRSLVDNKSEITRALVLYKGWKPLCTVPYSLDDTLMLISWTDKGIFLCQLKVESKRQPDEQIPNTGLIPPLPGLL